MEFIKKCLRASVLVILVGLVTSGVLAYGQATSATLNGTITDSAGASIPGVQVEVKNINTGVADNVTTNDTGYYSATLLPPGQYTAAVQKSGFRKSIQTGIILTVGQVATVNISLAVGDVKETVTVTASEELINTTTADIGTVINSQSVSELPLNGRDPSVLVYLAPGVTNITHMDTNKVGSLQGGNSFPAVDGVQLEQFASGGGGRQGSTYFTLDGAPNMDFYLLSGLPAPNSDATQEFRIVTSGFDAQYGFSPSAVVLIQTKSGTNAFHGGAFEFIRNNDLNAADYFSKKVNPLKRNQFGGFVGGPIFKDKLFFFANYQDTRTNTTVATGSANFPTPAMLTGDFSVDVPCVFGANNPQCMNDQAGLQGFKTVGSKNFQIDPLLFSPAALKIVKNNMPSSSDPTIQNQTTGQMHFSLPPSSISYSENTDRIDWTVNNKQRMFLRSYINYFNQTGGATPGNIAAVSNWQYTRLYNETLGHSWLINDSTVNNLALGFVQENSINGGLTKQKDGSNFCLSTYMAVSDPNGACYLTDFAWGGGGSVWSDVTAQRRTTWSLTESVAKTVGNLTLTSGIDLHKQFSEEDTTYPANGLVTLGGGWNGSYYTGDGLADLLLGNVGEYVQGGGEVVPLKGWQYGLYSQAQYKVKPNLTVSAGLRWDPATPPDMVSGAGAVFKPGVQSTMYPNAPQGIVFPGDANISKALMPRKLVIFEPRIGVSWQPSRFPHTAIRAGLGEYSGPVIYNYYNHAVDIAPFAPTYYLNAIQGDVMADGYRSNAARISLDNPWAAPTSTGTPYPAAANPDPFKSPNGGFNSASYKPPTNYQFATPISIGQSFSPDFEPSNTTTWSLSIEQQLAPTWALHLAYVGSFTDHAMLDIDANYCTPSATISCGNPGNLRPNANFATVDMDVSSGISPYNALQVGIDKKISYGFQFQSNFTWSKVLDQASIGSVAIGNPEDLHWNYGISSINVPFNSVTNFVYTSPELKGWNPIARAVLGTWQVSTIYTMQSGEPFAISGNNSSNDGEGGEHAVRVSGQPLNVRQGGRSKWLTNYFNTAAFASNAPGTHGYAGKNIMVGPPLSFADSSFSKNWKAYNRYGLQLRVDMFNTFNHTSFGLPSTSPTIGGFQWNAIDVVTNGQHSGHTGPEPSRRMQGDIKITF